MEELAVSIFDPPLQKRALLWVGVPNALEPENKISRATVRGTVQIKEVDEDPC
jgi:hypothetical protein